MVVNNAAQYGMTLYAANKSRGWERNWLVLVKPLVWTRLVVVRDVFIENVPQMGLVDDDQLIQTLVPHRSDPPFGIGIRIRRTKRRPNDTDTHGSEHRIKRRD